MVLYSANASCVEVNLLEPDLEGQGGFEKVEELGKAFQDVIGLEAREGMAYSRDNDISRIKAR